MRNLTALTACTAVIVSLHPAYSQGMEEGDFFSKFQGRATVGQAQAGKATAPDQPTEAVEEASLEQPAVDPVETGSTERVATSAKVTVDKEAAAQNPGDTIGREASPALVAVSRSGNSKMLKLPGVEQPTFGVETKATEVEVVRGVTAATSSSPKYSTIVSRYASSYGVPLSLAHAVISVESNYRSDARGSAGEIGLMQIKPATARMLGYSGSAKGLYDPDTNIRYGMKYLAMAKDLSDGSTCGTILKYNAGHGATRMNPISAAYCSKVKRILGK